MAGLLWKIARFLNAYMQACYTQEAKPQSELFNQAKFALNNLSSFGTGNTTGNELMRALRNADSKYNGYSDNCAGN